MLNLRLARFEHLVDIGRVDELRGVERVDGSLVIRAATRDSVIEFDPTVAADVPLLAAVTPLHRPLPDPQPGHDRRLARPRRPGGGVPGGRPRSRRVVRHRVGRRGSRDGAGGGLLHRRVVDGARGGRAAAPSPSRCGAGAAGSAWREFARRHGDFAIAGAVAAVELDDADAVVRCAIAVFGVAATPTRASTTEAALTGRTIGEIDPSAVGRMALEDVDDVADDLQVPAAYRRRVGAAMVGDAWRRAVGGRRGQERSMTAATITMSVNGAARQVTADARKTLADFAPRGPRPHRHAPRLRARGVRSLHRPRRRRRRALVPDLRRAGRRRRRRHDRGARPRRRRAQPRPAGDARLPRAAVRVLHARASSSRSPPCSTDDPDPDDEAIRDGLSGNLCRCTGYQGIIKAVRMAADARSAT